MKSHLILRSNPYMAKTDGNGRFVISDLPAGEHVFRIWHERMGYLRACSGKGFVANSTGRVKITIKPGENDLGEIRLSHAAFD